MRSWITRPLGAIIATVALVVIAAVAMGGIVVNEPSTPAPAPTPTATSTPDPGLANLWVKPGGAAAPQRCSTPCPYDAARAYGSFAAAAAAAAESGDVIRVKAGEYPRQGSIGAVGKTVTFIGERVDGRNAVVVDSGSPSGGEAYETFNLSGGVLAQYIDVTGAYPIVQYFGSGNQWRDSSFTGRRIRRCDSDEPLLIQDDESGSGYTITDNTLGPGIDIGAFRGQQGGCEGDGNLHLEQIRFGQGARDFLIDRTTFRACPKGRDYVGCGSGHIFLTTVTGNAPPIGITIRNSKFLGTPNKAIETNQNLGTTDVKYTIAYNTFANNPFVANSAIQGVRMIGNLGPREQICTSGFTWTQNVWQHDAGTPCGSDRLVTGPSFSTSALGLDPDFDLLPGSPAIDAAESPGRSDYCTGALGSLDFGGAKRPVGTACDAGAVEQG